MKLNGKMMVAVAMMVGSMGAIGCNKANDSSNEPVAPEQTVAEAPVDNDGSAQATPGVEKDSRRVRYYAPYAPPRARYEERGRAPSERHFWTPGYHRWDGRRYVWNDGRWAERRAGYEYVGPRWVNSYGRWEYLPGHWQRRF